MRFNRNRARTLAYAVALAVAVLDSGCVPVIAGEPAAVSNVGRDQFPQDDAVILRRDQKWTLNRDGSTRYEEHRWVKLLTGRSYRSQGDPRIGYREGIDDLEIITARTHLPDGSIIDVPEYSFNVVSPDDVARWPVYEQWREMVVNFSGVQEDAVLELHYARTTKPGADRWLWADVRLNGAYPVVQRSIEVTLPGDMKLRHHVDHVPVIWMEETVGKSAGGTIWRWGFHRLDPCADEPAAILWQQRCGRLRFTNCPDSTTWAVGLLTMIDSAAQPDDAVRKFAADIAEQQVDERSRVREISSTLRKSFNFVHAPRAWMNVKCRLASETFHSNYGSRAESAALLTAMLRSVGLDARPMMALSDWLYDDSTPVDSSVSAFVVAVATDDGPVYVEPSTGIIQPVGDWAERSLVGVTPEGKPTFVPLAEDRGVVPNTIVARADIKIDGEGRAAGHLKVRMGGLFVDAESLREDDAKKSAVDKLLAGLLSDFEVTTCSSSELSPGRFQAEADIASKEKLPQVAEQYLLTLAKDSPFTNRIHLPLSRSQRRSSVRLACPFTEDIELVVEFPGSWAPAVLPIGLPVVSGGWGTVEQVVRSEPGKLVINRRVGFEVRQISPADFAVVRDALNALRSDAARRVLVGPKAD